MTDRPEDLPPDERLALPAWAPLRRILAKRAAAIIATQVTTKPVQKQ